jgi:4-alpha-glucanotransferase
MRRILAEVKTQTGHTFTSLKWMMSSVTTHGLPTAIAWWSHRNEQRHVHDLTIISHGQWRTGGRDLNNKTCLARGCFSQDRNRATFARMRETITIMSMSRAHDSSIILMCTHLAHISFY